MAQRKVAEFKEVTGVYQSNGTATLQFYTDMPGGALAARLGAGVTLPSTGGIRKPFTVPLEIPGTTQSIEGALFYPQITPGPATQLRLFSMVVHVRPIGIYLDGSTSPQGEIWSTPPMAIGA